MWEDEIVNEVHRVREEYAARFDYNLDAIYKDIKKREYLNRHKIVALAVKQDWPADVPEETQEDIDLLRAVKEGEEGGNVSREEVFCPAAGHGMMVAFRANFARDLRTIRDADLLARIQAVVEAVEQAERLQDIPNLIKMQGGGSYHRLRVSDYQLGLSAVDNVVAFVRCLNRSEISKNFP